MEHLICRCKHCKREYTYCTYGNGPQYGTESGCTREYCAECANAIQNALKNIPIRYEGRPVKITDSKEEERINKIFDIACSEYKETVKIGCARMIGDWGYDKMEGCYIDKIMYYRGTKENNIKEIFIFNEYDLINKTFTGKHYFENHFPNKNYFPLTQLKFSNLAHLKEKTLPKPSGKLFFNDLEWEVVTKKI